MYRDDATKKFVSIDLTKVTAGKESYVSYMKAITKHDIIDQYEVVRIEDHEIAWFPQDVFDFLVAQEGTFTLDANGNESTFNGTAATRQNAISQYFLQKYPPVAASDPTR